MYKTANIIIQMLYQLIIHADVAWKCKREQCNTFLQAQDEVDAAQIKYITANAIAHHYNAVKAFDSMGLLFPFTHKAKLSSFFS